MDADGKSQFDSVCNSIITKLEALRSIHTSDQLRRHTGNPECNTKAVDYQLSSGMTTVADTVGSSHLNAVCLPDIRLNQVSDFAREKNYVGCSAQVSENIQESKKIHLSENITIKDHGRDDQRLGMALKDDGKEKENSPGRSPQPMEVLREQARRWVYEEVIGVFQEQSGEASKIEAPISGNEPNIYMSNLVGNMSKVLKERVEQMDIEARKAVELKEALSAEKSVVETMQQKQHFLRGLLDRALNTAENGIFMCNQCQLIVEKVNELCHCIQKDSKAIHCQFIPNEPRGTCHNADNLQNSKDSITTSIKNLLNREDGKEDNLVNPIIQSSSNVSTKIWTGMLNETHPMLSGNIWGTTASKLVNVNDARVELEPNRNTIANSEPFLKRKWLNDDHDEGRRAKAPKVSMHTPKVQCPNDSEGFNSSKTSEMNFAKKFHPDTVGEPDLTCDHNKTEDEKHLVGQAGTFRLLLEEEFDDDLE